LLLFLRLILNKKVSLVCEFYPNSFFMTMDYHFLVQSCLSFSSLLLQLYSIIFQAVLSPALIYKILSLAVLVKSICPRASLEVQGTFISFRDWPSYELQPEWKDDCFTLLDEGTIARKHYSCITSHSTLYSPAKY